MIYKNFNNIILPNNICDGLDNNNNNNNNKEHKASKLKKFL